MTMRGPIGEQQRAALKILAAAREPFVECDEMYRLVSRDSRGSLIRRGLITCVYGYRLTDAGRAELEQRRGR